MEFKDIIREGSFSDINNNSSWVRAAKDIEKEFKRLKLGKPEITSSRYGWSIISKNPVEFQDGHVGRLKILLSKHRVYTTPQWSITDPDLSGYSFGDSSYNLSHLKPVSKEVLNKQKAFAAVKKLFPNSTMTGNTITIL